MLDGLKWDGEKRAGTLLHTYLARTTPAPPVAIERLFLCGAVKRAFHPGCKFDYTIVLAGRGGIGKSTFARRIALDDRYFCDSIYDLGNIKATGEALRGKWVVELAELTGISGRSLEAVKAGLVRQTDTFRVPTANGRRTSSAAASSSLRPIPLASSPRSRPARAVFSPYSAARSSYEIGALS